MHQDFSRLVRKLAKLVYLLWAAASAIVTALLSAHIYPQIPPSAINSINFPCTVGVSAKVKCREDIQVSTIQVSIDTIVQSIQSVEFLKIFIIIIATVVMM